MVFVDLAGYAVVAAGPDRDSKYIAGKIQYQDEGMHLKGNRKWERMIKATQEAHHLDREGAVNYLRDKYKAFGIDESNYMLKATVTVENDDGPEKVRREVLDALGKDFEEKYINHNTVVGQRFNRLFCHDFISKLFGNVVKPGDVIDISEFWEIASHDFVGNVLGGRTLKGKPFKAAQFASAAADYAGGAPPILSNFYKNKQLWQGLEAIAFPLMFTDLPVVGLLRNEGAGEIVGLADNAPENGTSLDWDAVVPQKGKYKGQLRTDHVRLHNVDNLAKPNHGVFYGDGVDITNQAWSRAQQLGLKPDASGTLKVPMDRIVGRAGGQAAGTGQLFYYVEIKVVPGTNKIITSYPTN